MNIFRAIELVGNYPAVSGLARTIFTVLGLLGLMGGMALGGTRLIENDTVVLLIIVVSAVMFTLPLYYPRR